MLLNNVPVNLPNKEVPAIIEKYKMPACLTPELNEKIFGAKRTKEMAKYRNTDNNKTKKRKRY